MADRLSPDNIIDFNAARLKKSVTQPSEPGTASVNPTDGQSTARIIPFESDSPVVHKWEKDPYLGVRFVNPASIFDEQAISVDDMPADVLLDAARRTADTPRGRRYLGELELRLFHARVAYIGNVGMSDSEREKAFADVVIHSLAVGDEIKGPDSSPYGNKLKRAASDLAVNVFGLSVANKILNKHGLYTAADKANGGTRAVPDSHSPSSQPKIIPLQSRR